MEGDTFGFFEAKRAFEELFKILRFVSLMIHRGNPELSILARALHEIDVPNA